MDTVALILSFSDIKTIFRAKQVCKKWRAIIESAHFARMLPKSINHIMIMILFGKVKTNGYRLSINPNITWDYVVANIDKPWSYNYLSANPNITLDIIKANPHIDWSYHYLSRNVNITWEFVESTIGYGWDFGYLSIMPIITHEVLDKYPEKIWNFARISMNNNFSIDNLLGFGADEMVFHKNLTFEKFKTIRHKFSDDKLALNPNITWDIVMANPDIKWNYIYLSSNPNITWDIVVANPDKPWSFPHLSQNINITREIVLANPTKSWNYIELSKRIGIFPGKPFGDPIDFPYNFDLLCLYLKSPKL